MVSTEALGSDKNGPNIHRGGPNELHSADEARRSSLARAVARSQGLRAIAGRIAKDHSASIEAVSRALRHKSTRTTERGSPQDSCAGTREPLAIHR